MYFKSANGKPIITSESPGKPVIYVCKIIHEYSFSLFNNNLQFKP